jgi:site-specific DNA-cytosine methylase
MLKVAHFDILWKELRTLEQRIGMLEDRLNSCTCVNVPSIPNRLGVISQAIGRVGQDIDANGMSGHKERVERTQKDTAINMTKQSLQTKPKYLKYSLELHLVKTLINDITTDGKLNVLRDVTNDANLFSTTCYGSSSCQLQSNTLLGGTGETITDHVDKNSDDDYYDNRKHVKRRKQRSSRYKVSEDNQELTHNFEQRDTYIDNYLRGIRIRYVLYIVVVVH